MKALIIAAGNGTRMQPVIRGRHKSLMPLLGLKIIERVILGAKEAGICEFVIVTGYKGNEIQEFLGKGDRYGVSITFVQNNDWEKANGISALLARKYFSENFVLLMSDHIFDPATLVRIQRIQLKSTECVLAVDKNLDSVLDVEDTTKAKISKGKVIDINKSLEDYNAYDTGMFVCSPYIFEVLKNTTARGKNSLTDGMRVLASEQKLRTFDIKGRLWADCDTYKDIKFAQKKLLKSLTKHEDGIVSKKFNRKISAFITKFLVKTPITPNLISLIIPLFAPLAFVMLSQGVYPWIFIGGLLVQFLSIIDGNDGEVARLKFMSSKWGEWLDPIMDRYVDSLIIAGLSWGYWRATGNEFIIPMAIVIMFLLMLDDYMGNKFHSLFGEKLRQPGLKFKRDSRLLVFALGAVTNNILFALLFVACLTQYKIAMKLISGKMLLNEEIKIQSYLHRSKI